MDCIPESSINFVPCMKWVRKGVAKANPEKVQLTEEELESIIKETKSELNDQDDVDLEELEAIKKCVKKEELSSDNEDLASGSEQIETLETTKKKKSKKKDDNDDEYNFAQYDDEDDEPDTVLGIGKLTVYASSSKDPYVTLDDADSEKEDDVIDPNDNLILIGHVEGDASILEVYVYNEEEGSLYVHHDMLLPAYPLCLEWLSFDPADEAPGNLCAVGTMSPIIEVWDLDVVNSLEPVLKLSKKKSGGKRHKDAVLDLAWNSNVPHVLASGSADETVLLWDLDAGKAAMKFSPFTDKVQSLEWHPFEEQTLLTGSCDSLARVFDCRTEDSFKSWKVEGEIERVLWNHFDPFCFLMSTNIGGVHYVDCRSDKPLWYLAAHSAEVTGLSLSNQCPGLLITTSNDGDIKTWDIASGETNAPVFISEKNMSIGAIQCLGASPDSPFVVCAGGDKKQNNFEVWDLLNQDSAVARRFSTRKLVRAVKCETSEDQVSREGVPMDTANEAAHAMESLSLNQNSSKKFLPSTSKKKKKISKIKKKMKK